MTAVHASTRIVPRTFRQHRLSKLTPEQVADMRRRWVPKGRGCCKSRNVGPSITDLAKEHRVTYYAAWSAIHRATHVQVRA